MSVVQDKKKMEEQTQPAWRAAAAAAEAAARQTETKARTKVAAAAEAKQQLICNKVPASWTSGCIALLLIERHLPARFGYS